jgi:hypothetical protein
MNLLLARSKLLTSIPYRQQQLLVFWLIPPVKTLAVWVFNCHSVVGNSNTNMHATTRSEMNNYRRFVVTFEEQLTSHLLSEAFNFV